MASYRDSSDPPAFDPPAQPFTTTTTSSYQFPPQSQPAPGNQPFSTAPTPPLPPAHSSAPPKRGIAGILAFLGMILLKFKSLLVLLKFGKFLSTASTMLLSVAAYSTIWGWKFATGFVLLIFVHEMGHVIAAWQKKLPVSAPMFIPFLGAMITLKENPRDALTEAYIGYGGPFLGAIGCTLTWGLYYLTGNYLFLAVASFSMMINLFNLIPVSPLDGGRIVTAISPRIWLVGIICLGIWFFVSHNVFVLIIAAVGAYRLWTQWKTMHTNAYFQISPQARLITTVAYMALVGYLAWGHSYTHHLMEAYMKSRGIDASI